MLRLSHLKASLWSSFPSRSAVELFFNELVPVWLMCACAQGLTCMPSKNCRLIKLFHWSTGGAYTKDRLQCTNKSQIKVKDFLNIINTGQKCNFMHNAGHWHSNARFQEAKRKTRIKNSTELLLWFCSVMVKWEILTHSPDIHRHLVMKNCVCSNNDLGYLR